MSHRGAPYSEPAAAFDPADWLTSLESRLAADAAENRPPRNGFESVSWQIFKLEPMLRWLNEKPGLTGDDIEALRSMAVELTELKAQLPELRKQVMPPRPRPERGGRCSW